MKLLLDTLSGKSTKETPIWMMRQAGRYLPEYRKVREKVGGFLNLCFSPEDACEVTLQPLRRFNLDAAIIFSDILIVPQILGLDVVFQKGEGPVVENIEFKKDLEKLSVKTESFQTEKISKALRLVSEKLPKDKTLIGFAGAPWTVATYIISKTKHDFDYCRRFTYQNPELMEKLIDLITEQTIIYLKMHIDSGAEVLQIFDSWSSALCEDEFDQYIIKSTNKIVKALKEYKNDVKIIGFPKGAGFLYEKYCKNLEIDAVSLDHHVPIEFAKELKKHKVIQGNLDPMLLLTNKDLIKEKTDKIMNNLSGEKFIFNLGHGINKETPIENVEFLVNYVKSFKNNSL